MALSTPCPLQASSLPVAELVSPGPSRSLSLSLLSGTPKIVVLKVTPGKGSRGQAEQWDLLVHRGRQSCAVFGGGQDPIKDFL